MPFIGWLLAGLSRIFATRLGSWIGQAMLFLGLSFATNEFLVEPIFDQIKASMAAAGGDAIGWLAFFNIDKYISTIFSAYALAAGKKVFLRRRGL